MNYSSCIRTFFFFSTLSLLTGFSSIASASLIWGQEEKTTKNETSVRMDVRMDFAEDREPNGVSFIQFENGSVLAVADDHEEDDVFSEIFIEIDGDEEVNPEELFMMIRERMTRQLEEQLGEDMDPEKRAYIEEMIMERIEGELQERFMDGEKRHEGRWQEDHHEDHEDHGEHREHAGHDFEGMMNEIMEMTHIHTEEMMEEVMHQLHEKMMHLRNEMEHEAGGMLEQMRHRMERARDHIDSRFDHVREAFDMITDRVSHGMEDMRSGFTRHMEEMMNHVQHAHKNIQRRLDDSERRNNELEHRLRRLEEMISQSNHDRSTQSREHQRQGRRGASAGNRQKSKDSSRGRNRSGRRN